MQSFSSLIIHADVGASLAAFAVADSLEHVFRGSLFDSFINGALLPTLAADYP